jgi:hypothetical protein
MFSETPIPSILKNIQKEDIKLKDLVNDNNNTKYIEKEEMVVKKFDDNFLKNNIKEKYF